MLSGHGHVCHRVRGNSHAKHRSSTDWRPRKFCDMADIKVDPKDGLAVQDLTTLDAAWLLDRERERERARL